MLCYRHRENCERSLIRLESLILDFLGCLYNIYVSLAYFSTINCFLHNYLLLFPALARALSYYLRTNRHEITISNL